MDQIPDYMKICFLALYNPINEMAYDTLKEQGFHIVRYLKKAVWILLLKYSSIFILFLNILYVILPLIHCSTINFSVGRYM